MTREKSWRVELYGIITVYIEKKRKKEKYKREKRKSGKRAGAVYPLRKYELETYAINIDHDKRNKLQDTYIVVKLQFPLCRKNRRNIIATCYQAQKIYCHTLIKLSGMHIFRSFLFLSIAPFNSFNTIVCIGSEDISRLYISF